VIIFILRVDVPPQKRTDAIKTIKAMIGPTEVKPGCQCCRLCSNVDNDDELILLEKWHSQESMEDHIRSDEFRKVLAVMDLATRQPEFAFITVSSTAGMELVERLRCKPETEPWAGPFRIGR
jgi:quinol monooxygenase YgiN